MINEVLQRQLGLLVAICNQGHETRLACGSSNLTAIASFSRLLWGVPHYSRTNVKFRQDSTATFMEKLHFQSNHDWYKIRAFRLSKLLNLYVSLNVRKQVKKTTSNYNGKQLKKYTYNQKFTWDKQSNYVIFQTWQQTTSSQNVCLLFLAFYKYNQMHSNIIDNDQIIRSILTRHHSGLCNHFNNNEIHGKLQINKATS